MKIENNVLLKEQWRSNMDEDLKEFCNQAYTTLEGAVLTGDADNHCIELVYRYFKDYIRVSYDEDNIILVSDYYPKEFNCGNADYCVDDYIMSIIRSYKKCSNLNYLNYIKNNNGLERNIDDPKEEVRDVILPDSVEYIEDDTSYDYTSLEQISKHYDFNSSEGPTSEDFMEHRVFYLIV